MQLQNKKTYAGLKLWLLTAVSFILVMGALTSRAGLSLSYNEVGLNANAGLTHYTWDDGKELKGEYGFNATLASDKYKAQHGSIGVYPGAISGNTVELFASLVSDSRGKPQDTVRMGENLSVNMFGRKYSMSTNTNFYDVNDGGGKGAAPIDLSDNTVIPAAAPYYWSQIYTGFSFSDVGVVNVWGTSHLDGRTFVDYNGVSIDQINLWSSIFVQFKTEKMAQDFYSGVAMMASPVPEPSSLSLVGLASLGLMRRRR
jgi:hypothetical protein